MAAQFHAARLLGGWDGVYGGKSLRKMYCVAACKGVGRPVQRDGWVRAHTDVDVHHQVTHHRSNKWYVLELEDVAAYEAVHISNLDS